jgi:hypothetical protein
MAVGPIMPGLCAVVEAGSQARRERLTAFRAGLYRCFPRRADALLELVDVELSGEKAFRRGHGA